MIFFKKKIGVYLCVLFLSGTQGSVAFAKQRLIKDLEKTIPSGPIEPKVISSFRLKAQNYKDRFGRVTPELQTLLYEFEGSFASRFTKEARSDFQDFVAEIGGKMRSPIMMPKDNTPYWLLDSSEFSQFRSTPQLPKKADIVIVGAGLTGSSAAYHLREAAREGKSVLVLEADRPAAQASGRNGGNFQLLSESYLDNYGGLVAERLKWLRSQHPNTDESILKKISELQVKALLRFSYHNFRRFIDIVTREKLECDFSPQGWLRIASSKDEEIGILQDMSWIHSLGIPAKIWPAEQIQSQLQLPAKFSGRFIPENGNYHPYKFVVGVLKKAIEQGVKFYSGIRVNKIAETSPGKVLITTSDGQIEASKVIVATNAFTPQLFPDLEAIRTVPSQIMNLEHVKNDLRGMTVTERNGDIYYNFPLSRAYQDLKGVKRGMVHFGLDFKCSVSDPTCLSRSEDLFRDLKTLTDARFKDTRFQPPSRVWVGPMAFTADQVPVIGFMRYKSNPDKAYKSIVIAAAFQGYGGSYCIQAGNVAAKMALSGEVHSDVPELLFSPKKFYQSEIKLSEIPENIPFDTEEG